MWFNKKFLLIFLFLLIGESLSLSLFRNKDGKTSTTKDGFTPKPNTEIKKTKLLEKCDPCPTGINCVPPLQCPAHVRLKGDRHPQICELPDGVNHGLCCTSGQNHTIKDNNVHYHHKARHASLTKVIEEARLQFAGMLQKKLAISGEIERGNPEFAHNLMFKSASLTHMDLMRTTALAHRAIEEVFASRIYKESENIPVEEFQLNHFHADFSGTPMENNCGLFNPPCPHVPPKYRQSNGECNNLQPGKTSWGAAGTPMERLLPPAYEDGVWAPKITSIDGTPLAGARDISRHLFPDIDRPHDRYNLMLMQFGQFFSHDVTQSASVTLMNGKPVSCCTEDGSRPLPPELRHFACFPISISPDDEFYSRFHQGCINFVRSSLAPNRQCRLSYGKQLSKVSHYIDGSAIYGSDEKTEMEVRSFQHGRIRMFHDYGKELLPLAHNMESCLSVERGSACFFAGDGRVNQIISLTAVHTLFAREHNRVAHMLEETNPHWSDDLLFAETKRIVIAELQQITYKEYLPLIIGSEAMSRFRLHLHSQGYSTDYDEDVNACITSEFSTAAFRFGHSTVDGKFKVHRDRKFDELIDIPDVMFNPSRLRQTHFYDEILKTLTTQPMQQVDASVTKGLSKFLFRGGNPFGLDLVALNIQRGRDHGVRPYNDYLELSGARRIHDFQEFGFEIGTKLSQVYHSPDDIDLWVGGVVEQARGDALVGPTFSDIIADQFSRFRKGDRYFHEHHPRINPGHFSEQQLQEIRKVTLARLLCDNSDEPVAAYSQNAFVRPMPGNELVRCDSSTIPSINFDAWRD